MFCRQCGKELTDGTKFCNGCGAPQGTNEQQQEAPQQQQETPQQQYSQNNTHNQSNTQDNKIMNILAYWLFFLPLVSTPVTQEGKFHANQGLLLLLASIAGSIVITILGAIFLSISWGLAILTTLLWFVFSIAILALVIIGMMNANKGEQKPLPVIGTLFTLIK